MDLKKNTRAHELLAAVAKNTDLSKKTPIDASAWFLGPKAENGKALLEFVAMAAQSQIDTRLEYMPDDPPFFSKVTEEHEKSIDLIRQQLAELLGQLKGSIPLASYRNQSHMYWDITLPGTAGYFAAMLYNQNNVAAEASPVTTLLEIQVATEFCEMLGFEAHPPARFGVEFQPWGHITCDGSIANGESMWAARNVKFSPIAFAEAIKCEDSLKDARKVEVVTCDGKSALLVELSKWELLNLPVDEAIGLIKIIEQQSGLSQETLSAEVDNYTVQKLGLVEFQRRFLDDYKLAAPLVLVPSTAHYSWPKTAALIGLGVNSVESISVDLDARMDIEKLEEKLQICLQQQRPVMQVVAVMGSTAEGAVDPLADILKLREKYQREGLNFVVHVDAAWGGYFRSLLKGLVGSDPAVLIDNYPLLYMNEHFKKHFSAIANVDTVTLDPHKSGFIPYPAGSLCYRNGDMRHLIAYAAPVVSHGDEDPSVGTYGIEGSKPGAAAASVYLSNKVIPLNMSGYGRLLGRCLFNSKRFYAALMAMDVPAELGSKRRFNITAMQRLPAEKHGSEDDVIKQKKYLKDNFVPCSTHDLINRVFGLNEEVPGEDQKEALELFQEIGSDLSIISYAFNFETNVGMNPSLSLMNQLTDKIFNRLSLHPEQNGQVPSVEMFVTASEFSAESHSEQLINDFARRAGVDPVPGMPIKYLISTTQNPWLSTTDNEFNMIDPLIDVLTKTVKQAIEEIIQEQEINADT